MKIFIFIFAYLISLNAYSIKLIPNFQKKYKHYDVNVMGFYQEDVLSLDGDPNGTACSNKHRQGDLSNRWCHTLVSKTMKETLIQSGYNKMFSNIVSSFVFVPKEYYFDEKPSLSDIVITEIPLIEIMGGEISFTYFLDKMAVFSFHKEF